MATMIAYPPDSPTGNRLLESSALNRMLFAGSATWIVAFSMSTHQEERASLMV